MAASRRQRTPAELREKVAPGPFYIADHQTFPLLTGLGVASLILFRLADGYGLVYVLGPFISPLIPAAGYTIFPWKPYRGQPFARKSPVDTGDPVVMRLVALFKSGEARVALWQAAAKLTGWLSLVSAAVVLLRHRPLNWSFPPGDQWELMIGSALGSFVALGAEYIGWGLRTWAEREMQRQSSG